MFTSRVSMEVKILVAIILLLLLGRALGADRPPRPILPPRPIAMAVEITAVQPFGPAYRAGLSVGDRIIEVDGARVQSLTELRLLLNRAGDFARLTVQYARSSKLFTVHVYPEHGRIGIDARMVEVYPYGRYPY